MGGGASIAQTNVIVPLGRQTAATSLALNTFVRLSLMQFSLACFTTQASDTSIEPQAVFRRGSVWKSVCTYCLCTLLQLPKCPWRRVGSAEPHTVSKARHVTPAWQMHTDKEFDHQLSSHTASRAEQRVCKAKSRSHRAWRLPHSISCPSQVSKHGLDLRHVSQGLLRECWEKEVTDCARARFCHSYPARDDPRWPSSRPLRRIDHTPCPLSLGTKRNCCSSVTTQSDVALDMEWI